MNSEIVIYQTDDLKTQVEVKLQQETVWLNQEQLSLLFEKERSVITKHLKNIFKEGELDEKSNVQILHISGSDKPVKFYNLDVIISVLSHFPIVKSLLLQLKSILYMQC